MKRILYIYFQDSRSNTEPKLWMTSWFWFCDDCGFVFVLAGSRLSSTSSQRTPCTTRWVVHTLVTLLSPSLGCKHLSQVSDAFRSTSFNVSHRIQRLLFTDTDFTPTVCVCRRWATARAWVRSQLCCWSTWMKKTPSGLWSNYCLGRSTPCTVTRLNSL